MARELKERFMTWRERIPRFTFYLQKTKGNPVFWLARESWARIASGENEIVRVSIEHTPLRNITIRDDYLGAIHDRRAHQVEIYRMDANDSPYLINKDTYSVIDSVEFTADVKQIIVQASTCENQNLRDFLSKHVLLIKNDPGKDHWLESVPAEVGNLLRMKKCPEQR
jgi:hypothetical protein